MSEIHSDLRPVFDPTSVAVIGATNNIGKWGYSSFVSISNSFGGEIYPVNNTEDTVLGYKAYRRVTDIPDDVDLAVFVIPAQTIPAVMEDCVKKGVKAALIISAGFAEVGEEGRVLQDRVMEIAGRGGIRVVGPNCMGFWSASACLRAFMFPLPVSPGSLGFVSQGGNVGGALVFSAYERGVGFHKYVSCGCAADIQIEDYIENFADDPKIKVIMAYIEGLNDGRRFMEKVRKVTARKPVIVMKPGKTVAAAEAIMSHSGALSGSNVICEAAFRESGVMLVESGEELLDLAVGFLTQPLPLNRNVAIVTPGGSYGVICADACASLGLKVVDLSEETISEFDRIFPPRWSHGNPVDPAGDRNFVSYLKAPGMLLELEEVGSLIFTGYGSFSALTTGLSFLETREVSGTIAPLLNQLSGTNDYFQALFLAAEAGDLNRIETLLGPPLSLVASMLGSREEDDIARFVHMVSSLIASGRMKMSSDEYDWVVTALGEGKGLDAVRDMALNLIDRFLTALVVYWIEKYKKPVITTNFSEGIPRLTGGVHLSYPSGERAAKVLARMVQYREHLEATGIWSRGETDQFEFTLLGCDDLTGAKDHAGDEAEILNH